MGLPLYLAITNAELGQSVSLPKHPAFMACHFSPYNRGLSNFPSRFPQGGMLIIDDSLPPAGHDASLILQQVEDLIKQFGFTSVLLDFQRDENNSTHSIACALTQALNCPVGISEAYANALPASPVFLPPAPPYMPLKAYLSPWRDREIWLEIATDCAYINITEAGAKITNYTPGSHVPVHISDSLHCRYQIHPGDRCVGFLINRTCEDLPSLLAEAEQFGVTRAVGLYQELREQ